MTGAHTLAAILERDYEVIPWQDAPAVAPRATGEPGPDTPHRVVVGGVVHRVSSFASVRYRGGAAVVNDGERVRIIVAEGELLLDDAEELALRSAWPTL